MLKLGEKIISDIYLGDKKIAKVFLGDKLVYQAGKPIFLDYVYFDNSSTSQFTEVSACYINTGIQNQDGIWAEITWKTTAVGRWLFGMGYNAQQDNFMFGHFRDTSPPSSYIGCGNASKDCSNPNGIKCADGKIHTAIIKYDKYILDGFESELSGNDNTYAYFRDIYLGTTNYLNRADGRGFIGDIYNFKLYNNANELIQDLRPCLDPKGTVCFYDTVTKKYFYNQGKGTLKAGGRFVESIVSDGNCYINTGIKASYDYTIKTKYMYTSFVGAYNCIFGTRSQAVSEGNKIYWVGCNSTGTKDLMLRLGKTTSPYSLKLNEVINLEITPNEAIINGTNLGDAMFDGEIGFDSNIYLFNINMNSDGSTALFASVARMYNFQIYNNNMELILDLRPYVDDDGVACFKDLVTNTLLYGQGTGTLRYTE